MSTDAKRAANARWDAKNRDRYTVLGCKVLASDADKYRTAAKSQHTSINAVLRQALDDMAKK